MINTSFVTLSTNSRHGRGREKQEMPTPDQVTIQGHPHIAVCPQPPAEWKSKVSAEAAAVLDRLPNSDAQDIVHMTRAIQEETIHTPPAPHEFAAGQFNVTFQDRESGQKYGFVFQTEAGPGHLHPVIPGKTPIGGGYISILKDPDDAHGDARTLNTAESDYLLDKLYQRYQTPMTEKVANLTGEILSYGLAIRYQGEGEKAVGEKHRSLTAPTLADVGLKRNCWDPQTWRC